MDEVIGRNVKGSSAHLIAAFVIAFSVLLIIPMWSAYGVMFPEEGGHAHAGDMVSVANFEAKTERFIEANGLADGSVRASHGEPIYVLSLQYTFKPGVLRLTAGERYELQMLSTDVVHAFSAQMGGTSYNAVVMPNMVTALELKPTKPGTYRVFCNDYCGIGHDYMYFTIVVEEPGSATQEDEGHHVH